jgi:hypothetical protein
VLRTRRRPSAFARAFVERASLARPTLSIERKLGRTNCPRILSNERLEGSRFSAWGNFDPYLSDLTLC